MMTKQEIYDTIKTHLLKQGHPARARPALGQRAGSCQYRNEAGDKCAIGCLIPDDEYDPIIENRGVLSLIEVPQLLTPGTKMLRSILGKIIDINDENVDFLNEFQQIHDKRSPLRWEEYLKYVAQKHGLNP